MTAFDTSPQPALCSQILGAIGKAVVAADFSGTITYWNPAAQSLYGWAADEVIGRSLIDVIPSETSRDLAATILEELQAGCSWRGELLVRRREGTVFPAQVTASPIHNEEGEVVGLASISRSTSAQKKALRQLTFEKERLQSVIEHAPAFMCVLRGRHYRLEIANAAFYDLTGHREIIGKPVMAALPELEGQGYSELLEEVYRTGAPFIGKEMPIRFQRTPGVEPETRFVNFVYQPLKDIGDATTGILVHGVDVTESVENERAARKREQQLRSLVEATAQIVWTSVPEGYVTRINDASTASTGQWNDKFVGWDWAEMLHPDDRACVIDTWAKHQASKTPFEMEHRVLAEDGIYRWVVIRGVPIVDEDGTLTEWIGTCTDVDDKKRAEAALQESEARYRTIVDTAHEAIWLVDAEGRTTFANARLARLLGYQPEELIGRSYLDLIDPADAETATKKFEQRRYGLSDTHDYRLRRRDGSVVWILDSATPLYDEQGRFAGSVGMMTDITQRKLYEQELVRAKKNAEEMARLKDAFLANMSHEIRTPLTAIIGFADILAEEATGESKSLANMIRKGGERLLLTLDSVLELAQLESGSLQLKCVSVDILEQVQDAIATLQKRAHRRGLYLRVLSEYDRLCISADRGALYRVLVNLIGNAVKFTEEGGVTVRLSRSDLHVEIAVEDTGIGISEEFLPRIFEDFKQESEGNARAYEGTGLGLSITRRLVELMDGSIVVTSEKGRGSTFTLRLPACDVEMEKAPCDTLSAARPPSRRPRILAVEDQPETCLVIQQHLSSLYDLTLVTCGDDALRVAAKGTFDLVLLDINLGGLSGVDVLQQLRALPEYDSMPVIACTAYVLPGDEQRFLDIGFDGYIPKPFRKAAFLEKIHSLLPTPVMTISHP